MDERRCKGVRATGEPCRSTAVDESNHCWAHKPGNEAARKAASARGGANRSTVARAAKALPADMRDVAALILRSLQAVEAETMKPGQAGAIAALAGAYVRVVDAGDVEARIAALEAALEGRRRA